MVWSCIISQFDSLLDWHTSHYQLKSLYGCCLCIKWHINAPLGWCLISLTWPVNWSCTVLTSLLPVRDTEASNMCAFTLSVPSQAFMQCLTHVCNSTALGLLIRHVIRAISANHLLFTTGTSCLLRAPYMSCCFTCSCVIILDEMTNGCAQRFRPCLSFNNVHKSMNA